MNENVPTVERNREIKQGSYTVKTISPEDMEMPTGESGWTLEDQVARHLEKQSQFGEKYDLPDEEYVDYLRKNHAKIDELFVGESRPEVSMVYKDADGEFTRMILVKDQDGHYREQKKGIDTREKERTHIQEDDLLFMVKKG